MLEWKLVAEQYVGHLAALDLKCKNCVFSMEYSNTEPSGTTINIHAITSMKIKLLN